MFDEKMFIAGLYKQQWLMLKLHPHLLLLDPKLLLNLHQQQFGFLVIATKKLLGLVA